MLRYEQNICALWLDHMWPGHKSPVDRLLGPHDFPLYLRIPGHFGCNYRPLRTIIQVIAMHTGERGIEMSKNIVRRKSIVRQDAKQAPFYAHWHAWTRYPSGIRSYGGYSKRADAVKEMKADREMSRDGFA